MRQIEADQPVMALRDLAPHEPPTPSKSQVNTIQGGHLFLPLWRYLTFTRTRKLLICGIATPWRSQAPCVPRDRAGTRPWTLRERLDERDIAELIIAYRKGATAASLAFTHSVSVTSVKRLLRTAGVRRAPSTRGSEKATPTTTST